MSDLRQCTRDFLTEFIELYRSLPCLWKVKSKEYNDRDKKNQAYQVLVAKYRECDRNANRDTVKKKINSLRSTYRKELLKVRDSLCAADGAEFYKPTLWYFSLFSFLNEEELPRELRWYADTEEEQQEEGEESTEIQQQDEANLPSTLHVATIYSDDNSSTASNNKSSYTTLHVPVPRKRKQDSDAGSSEMMTLLEEKLKSLPSEDNFDVYGKHIAHKLRRVHGKQYIFAQKLINDVLFEADMGNLSQYFQVIDCSTTQ